MSNLSTGIHFTFTAELEYAKTNCEGGLYDRKQTGNDIIRLFEAVPTMLIRFLMDFKVGR